MTRPSPTGSHVLYLLDANVLITAHRDYYAVARVPEFWHWLQHQAAAGRVKVPAEILEEVKRCGRAPRNAMRRVAEYEAREAAKEAGGGEGEGQSTRSAAEEELP